MLLFSLAACDRTPHGGDHGTHLTGGDHTGPTDPCADTGVDYTDLAFDPGPEGCDAGEKPASTYDLAAASLIVDAPGADRVALLPDLDGDGQAEILVARSAYAPDGTVAIYPADARGRLTLTDAAALLTNGATPTWDTRLVTLWTDYDDSGPALVLSGDSGSWADDWRVYPWPLTFDEASLAAPALTLRAGLGAYYTSEPGAYEGSTAPAGDLDGDGYGELLVEQSFQLYDPDGPFIQGALIVHPDIADGAYIYDTDDYIYPGPGDCWDAPSSSGDPRAAGDVNGDGYDDVMLGGVESGGRAVAWLFHGPVTGETYRDDAAARLEGAGTQITDAGDLDGDGATDFVAGVDDRSGPSRIVYGPFSGVRDASDGGVLVDPSEGSTLRLGAEALGDLDGDGNGEVLLQETWGTAPLAGILSGPICTDTSLPMGTLFTPEAEAPAPVREADALDVDGDGRKDIALLMHGTDTDRVYLVTDAGR